MTVELDPPRRIGAVTVAALVTRHVVQDTRSGTVAFTASKSPLAILIADAGGVRALDLAGKPVDAGTLEGWCPGALARFARAARQDPPNPEPGV
jgi:hypothetical protein